MSQTPPFTNRLAQESSPYLRQHAHNPVDWYPWGPEALERARQLDQPIFLSIGYSACHWCHVMEHESFENTEIAKILNEHFISIKVDREERPDLDQIYMTAVQMLTGQGGWPMSVFLTPDLQPFYGGTYFPPQDHYGRSGFQRLLLTLADWWRQRRDELDRSAQEITEHLQKAIRLEAKPGALEPDLLRQAVARSRRHFDATHGGFGSAPKFPHPMELRLLLHAWKRFGDENALQMACITLDHMAMGGLYDHLGGGFHRYSTDARWLVPHFEKMLYDNALLVPAYLGAFQATGNVFYREVVQETLTYVLRDMTSPEGAFYSTQDADSEGVEGRFYVWSNDEIEQVLGKDSAQVFNYVYGVSPEGNWEGHNILHRMKTYAQCAQLLNIAEPELRRLLQEAQGKLLEVRGKRIWPGRDEKVLTSWNGLMISALAQAAQVLPQPSYAEAASRCADFLLQRLRTSDGRLLRTWSQGTEAKLNGYLEDYAFLLEALVRLYEATFAPRWLESALNLAEVMIDQFWDATETGFFYTGRFHESLIARTKDPHDSSIPSGNALGTTALLHLAKLTGRIDLGEKAEATLQLFRGLMAETPMAAGQMLLALDFYLGPVQEFAVIGDLDHADTTRVLQAIHARFRPNKVVAQKAATSGSLAGDTLIPLLAGKSATREVTTYLCQNFTCAEPWIGVEAAEQALAHEELT